MGGCDPEWIAVPGFAGKRGRQFFCKYYVEASDKREVLQTQSYNGEALLQQQAFPEQGQAETGAAGD
jgi:hypothetical protein